MNTSTTTSSSSSRRLEDSLSVSSIQVLPRFDVDSKPAQPALMTTVQISPVWAPPEITRAIRRQKQAAAVVYPDVPDPPKEKFKVILGRDFHPDSTRFIVTSSHCLSRGSTNNHQHYRDRATVGGQPRVSRRSRSFHSGSLPTFTPGTASHVRPVTWSRGSDICHKQQVGGEQANTWSRQQINKYHTPLHVVSRSVKPSQDETLPEVWNTNMNSTSGVIETAWKLGHSDSQAIRASTLPHVATTDTSAHSSTTWASLNSTSSHLQVSTRSAVHQTSTQKVSSQRSVEAMPGLQFADAVLGSVGWNLDHLYQLCQTQFRYYEYFEPLNPGTSLELSPSNEQKQSLNYFAVSNYAPHFNVPKPPLLKSTHVTPSLMNSSPSSPLSQNLSFAGEIVGDSSLTRPTTTCCQNVLPDSPTCQQGVKVPFNSGNLPQVVTDSDKQSVSTTRSILKAPRIYRERGRLFTDNFANITVHDCRSTSGSVQRTTVTGGDVLTVSRVTGEPTVMPGSSSPDLVCKDKGRLVRFSADDQIHEFTSLEPVASNCRL